MMKRTKNFILLILAMFIGLGLVGCGGNDNPNKDDITGDTETPGGDDTGGDDTGGDDTGGDDTGGDDTGGDDTDEDDTGGTVIPPTLIGGKIELGKIPYVFGTGVSGQSPVKSGATSNDISFELEGYGVGTTGGEGATAANIHVVKTANEFINILPAQKSTTPMIIYIEGEMNIAGASAQEFLFKEVSNVSIIGLGSNASLNGIGIRIERCNNFIVQNLEIHHVLASAAEGDGIGIIDSKQVWVDHCEFYSQLEWTTSAGQTILNESASVKDKYDAMLDIKKESDNITISWNYFHDGYKTGLAGYSDKDTYNRHITFHHNIYANVNSRVPLLRAGTTHIYNNYYYNIMGTGINSRFGNKVFVENTIFENAKQPVCSIDSKDIGSWNLKGIIYENCFTSKVDSDEVAWGGVNMASTTDYTPTYQYTVNSTTYLKDIVLGNAGVGVYNIKEGNLKMKVVDDAIAKINEIGTIAYTTACYNAIQAAIAVCSSLTEELLALVTNYDVLTSAISTYYGLAVQAVISYIDQIGSVTSTSGQSIRTARAAYNSLLADYKSQVTNYSVLTAAESAYSNYAVTDVINKINQISNPVVLASLTTIEEAREMYDLLTQGQKSQVTNYNVLVAAEAEYTSLNAIEQVKTAINSIGIVTVQSGSLIAEVRSKYNALSENQKLSISADILKILTDAEEAYEIAIANSKSHNFATDGATSNYFIIAGSVSNGRLKLDSNGSIQFTTTGPVTLVIQASGKSAGSIIQITGTNSYSYQVTGVDTDTDTYTITITTAGTYTIAKKTNETYIYSISVS